MAKDIVEGRFFEVTRLRWIVAAVSLLCVLPVQAQLRGVAAENIDRKADPCENFDVYANGQWRATHPMPAKETRWAVRSVTQDETLAKLRTIAEDDAKKASTLRKGTPAELTGDLYGACMDQATIDSRGLAPLKPLLAQAGAVRDAKALSSEIVRLHGIGLAAPLVLFASQNAHDPKWMIAQISIAGNGLPDRDYYLRDEERFKNAREKYRAYMQKMFVMAGASDADAVQSVDAVMKMETAVAKAQMTRVELRDPQATDHPMSFAELKKLAPHFDWDSAFGTMKVPTAGTLNVEQPRLLQVFDDMLATTPIDAWRAYFQWRLLNGEAAYLGSKFEDARFGFFGMTLNGAKENRPRWQRCVQVTDGMVGEALGHEYVDRYLPPEAKARARTMAVNIVNELKLSIESRDWMSEPTKKKALEKVDALNIKIGYPDKWKDYAGITFAPKTYFENVQSAMQFKMRDDLGQIGKPVDRGRWDMTPPTMNAYYNPLMNEVVVPAGYLQPPGFDPRGLDAINYGAVGVSIGHEISHGVDDEGAQFAADGKLEKWWTDVDYKKFEEKTGCTTRQYDGYFVEPGLHLQGKFVTGEALGDLGGVNLAFRAYERSRKGKGPEPTVDGFTPEQQFFLAEGQWRGAIARPEAARVSVSSDPHPPGNFRVIGPLSNMPEFARAFSCKAGDKMVRRPEDQCVLW